LTAPLPSTSHSHARAQIPNSHVAWHVLHLILYVARAAATVHA